MQERGIFTKELQTAIERIKNSTDSPDDVPQSAFELLRLSFQLGNDRVLSPVQKAIVVMYYATNMRFSDITDQTKRKVLRTNLFTAMSKMWEKLPHDLLERLPKKDIELLKKDDASNNDEDIEEEQIFYGRQPRRKPAQTVFKKSAEHRKKIGDALRGRKLSSSHKENISKGVEKKWEDPNYRDAVMDSMQYRGALSDETRAKISKSKTRKPTDLPDDS